MSARLDAAVAELVAALREELRAEAMPAPPRLLSVAEVGALTGLGRSIIYELLADGRLGSVKVGRRRLVSLTAVQAFIAEAAA